VTEPSATQELEQITQRHGVVAIAWVIARTYWKPLSILAGAVGSFAVFMWQFHELQRGQDAQENRDKVFAAQLLELKGNVSELKGTVATLQRDNSAMLTNWGAVTAAADIVVSKKEPSQARQRAPRARSP
jgi:hypothetical protein